MILNLTQHHTTPEQRSAGVVDLPPETREELGKLLTFEEIPSWDEIVARAKEIVELARPALHAIDGGRAMIGGAPFLMTPLESGLYAGGFTPVFAFSKRVVEEEPQPDGSIVKKSVFKHIGFVGDI